MSQFRIVDELISLRLFRSLMDKNRPLLSARAYAYRLDLTPHDALAYISREFSREQRVFVAEFDFSKFFDTISHDYLRESFDSLGLRITPLERQLVESFLTTAEPYLTADDKYKSGLSRARGIPQGTSISLFLANLAAAELDRALERLGVGFARYADDTLIWSHAYSDISEAVDALHAASANIGSEINLQKSHGVRLLVPEGTRSAEMASTPFVHYLGHELTLRRIRMKPSAIDRIKSRVNNLLYSNLLREPIQNNQNLKRLSGQNDRDYITFIWQLRRYLYGSLSENQVRKFQAGAVPAMSFEGAMSYFPLVNDEEQLAMLDGWIASQTWLALQKRRRLLAPKVKRVIQPWPLSRGELVGAVLISGSTGESIDLRLPSVRRIAAAIRLSVEAHGLGVLRNSAELYVYEDDAAVSAPKRLAD